MPWPANTVPNHSLRTLMKLVLPIPTPSIFIISLLILIKSAPKNEVIPLNSITLSVSWIILSNVVVTAVDTTGDWIILSNANNALAFGFVATNLWEVPIPTLVISKTFGTTFKASSALLANLIASELILTTNTSDGTLSVVPIPAKDVDAIPIAIVEALPEWL